VNTKLRCNHVTATEAKIIATKDPLTADQETVVHVGNDCSDGDRSLDMNKDKEDKR
jgi:hypothetical protein